MSNTSDFIIKTGLWGDPDAIVLQKYAGTGTHVVVPDEVTVIGWNAFVRMILWMLYKNPTEPVK